MRDTRKSIDLRSLEQSFANAVAAPYLSQSKQPCQKRLQSWRYRSYIPLLHRLHGQLTGLRTHHCMVDNRKLVWLQGGNPEGEPVLLLHGFGSCKENWVPLLPFLMRHYQLFVPDLPGWGQSHFCAEKVYGFDQQVERLDAWGKQVLPGPVHIVGSSMGGGIAALLAARHPELTKTLTLMNAAGVAGNDFTPFERGLTQGRNSLIAHNVKGVLDLLGTTMANPALPLIMTPFACWDLVSRRHVNQHMFRQLLQYTPCETRPSVSEIKAPTLILWGDKDNVIHITCSDTYKALIPHAKTKLLKGIGHMPMVEAPRLTSRLLQRFWKEEEKTEARD
ncbi:MAG: alpha/beta fold hydrolase [Pseudomonadales bacterium]|uniref:Putative Hydrolase or acyltransferase (Alpha/beta hydrolase superfamily) protein n=1 Tax=Oleiphilus messinensis TaxID=141451 RepID=A0A1Y0I1R8_9GAMM|nr:alpha/beta fold hydrolase [Oleiphilus messinensis]ARU54392.1 putative Hydrolase or acyltransferase (alpha/beta hydrolase superfamily) protein [Oleiphilus messinensis]MCG8613492.1 alpha/beta fold hydrolase [Pseudomonadales bacterium]